MTTVTLAHAPRVNNMGFTTCVECTRYTWHVSIGRKVNVICYVSTKEWGCAPSRAEREAKGNLWLKNEQNTRFTWLFVYGRTFYNYVHTYIWMLATLKGERMPPPAPPKWNPANHDTNVVPAKSLFEDLGVDIMHKVIAPVSYSWLLR